MLFKFTSILIFFALVSCAPSKMSTPAHAFDVQDNLPAWVNNPNDKYPSELNLVGLGVSRTKQGAENDALNSISKIFSSKVKVDENIIKSVQESDGTKASNYRNSTNLIKNISVSTNQSLTNTRMAEFFYDEKERKYYVLAVMEKQSTADLIKKDIKGNAADIEKWKAAYLAENDVLRKFQYLNKMQNSYAAVKLLGDMLPILDAFDSEQNYGITKQELAKFKAESSDACLLYIEKSKGFPKSTEKKIREKLSSVGFKLASDKSSAKLIVDLNYDAEKAGNDQSQIKFVHWSLACDFIYNGNSIATYEKSGRDGQLTFKTAQKRAELKMAKMIDKDLASFLNTDLFK